MTHATCRANYFDSHTIAMEILITLQIMCLTCFKLKSCVYLEHLEILGIILNSISKQSYMQAPLPETHCFKDIPSTTRIPMSFT